MTLLKLLEDVLEPCWSAPPDDKEHSHPGPGVPCPPKVDRNVTAVLPVRRHSSADIPSTREKTKHLDGRA